MRDIEWMSPIIAAFVLYFIFKIDNRRKNRLDLLPIQTNAIGLLVLVGIINCILILAGALFLRKCSTLDMTSTDFFQWAFPCILGLLALAVFFAGYVILNKFFK